MRWSSAVSDIASLTRAVDDTAEQVEIGLDGPSADLVFAFISSHHAPSYYSVVELVRSRFPGATVIGCSAGGVASTMQTYNKKYKRNNIHIYIYIYIYTVCYGKTNPCSSLFVLVRSHLVRDLVRRP